MMVKRINAGRQNADLAHAAAHVEYPVRTADRVLRARQHRSAEC